MRKLLMVAFHYPPIRGSSGVQRTLKFSRYLPSLGWQPIVLGAVLVLFALIAPKALTWVHRVWMMAGQALGAINSRIILTLIFYGVLTPMGAVMRLWRRDPMYRALEPSATTYRVVRQARPASHMKQQF